MRGGLIILGADPVSVGIGVMLSCVQDISLNWWAEKNQTCMLGFHVYKRTCNGLAVFWPTLDLAEI